MLAVEIFLTVKLFERFQLIKNPQTGYVWGVKYMYVSCGDLSDSKALWVISTRQLTFCSDSQAQQHGSPNTERTLSSYDDIPSLLLYGHTNIETVNMKLKTALQN